MLFFLSPTHIAAPSAKELTNHISNGVPFVVPEPMTFMRPQFTRASIATLVDSQGLIEVVPADTRRFDHDPVTLAPKGMLLETSQSNIFINSDSIGSVALGGVTIAPSTDFPLFASGNNDLIITGNGVSGGKSIKQNTTIASSSDRTYSIFLRRGSNNFAQLVGQSNETYFCIFDLLNGVIGAKGATIRSAKMQPFVNGWYRCSVTTRSPITTIYMVILVNSNSIPRGGTPLTNPSATIYVAAAQVENGASATSYIPTGSAAVTRAADGFEEVEVPYPAQLDLLGAAVTRGHVGLPLASGETAGMARLGAEGGGLREWGGELLFVS